MAAGSAGEGAGTWEQHGAQCAAAPYVGVAETNEDFVCERDRAERADTRTRTRLDRLSRADHADSAR